MERPYIMGLKKGKWDNETNNVDWVEDYSSSLLAMEREAVLVDILIILK